MKSIYPLLIASILGLTLSACNQQANQFPVGIIDLDRISQETGHTEMAQAKLTELRSSLQKDLSDTQERLKKEMLESQSKMGDKPTEEQQAEMGQIATNMQTEMMQKQSSASQTLQSKQTELVTSFRNNVRAIADGVAQKRGMHIILLRNPSVLLGNDEKVDITDAVLAEMKKTGGDNSAAEKSEMPASK